MLIKILCSFMLISSVRAAFIPSCLGSTLNRHIVLKNGGGGGSGGAGGSALKHYSSFDTFSPLSSFSQQESRSKIVSIKSKYYSGDGQDDHDFDHFDFGFDTATTFTVPSTTNNAFNKNDNNGIEFSEQEIQAETYRCNLLISKLIKNAQNYRTRALAAQQAHDILSKMDHPDTVAYNTVISAYAKCSSDGNYMAAETAQELLEEMEQLNLQQAEANRKWYERNQNGELSNEEIIKGAPRIRIKPNVRTFSCVMDAWAKQNSRAGALQAEAILDRLLSKYKSTGDIAYQPNAITYNTIISAWANSNTGKEAAQKCVIWMRSMDTEKIDIITFNIVLNSLARSGLPNVGQRAEELFRNMPVEPNIRTYCTVINAWSQSFGCHDAAQRAHQLLLEVEALSKEQNAKIKPNCILYTSVINAYARSKHEPLKAHKSFELLQRMIELSKTNPSVRPNLVTYNSVLNACAASNPNFVQKAILAMKNNNNDDDNDEQDKVSTYLTLTEMVRRLYHQLIHGITDDYQLRPDYHTFGTVLKAITNLFWGEPDQRSLCQSVFEEACQRGQVTAGVLFQLRQAAPSDLYRALIPPEACDETKEFIDITKVPRDWTRNTPKSSNRIRRKRS